MLILQFILAFGVMLFLHEFGHFIVSKAFGIEVEEFGFGLPPRICRLFTWKGTEFTLNLLKRLKDAVNSGKKLFPRRYAPPVIQENT